MSRMTEVGTTALDHLLADLNPQQRTAAQHGDGPLLIVAGAGTGKTTTLAHRVASLIDAFLSAQSNRLNQVMKLMTVIATIFMPLTVLTGMFGMNVKLPHMPGPDWMEFWWITMLMAAISAVMLWMFRRNRWI